MCLSICLSVCLSVYLSVSMFVCLFVYLSVCMFICLRVCLFVCLSVCLCACVCLSVCVHVCLCVCLSVCAFVCLIIRFTWAQPVMVPPVPIPPTRMSTLPLVWNQISGPVVSLISVMIGVSVSVRVSVMVSVGVSENEEMWFMWEWERCDEIGLEVLATEKIRVWGKEWAGKRKRERKAGVEKEMGSEGNGIRDRRKDRGGGNGKWRERDKG